MRKLIWTYGLLSGALVTGVLVIGFASNDPEEMNFGLGELIGYLSMLLAFGLVFIGARQAKIKYLNNKATFGKIFKIAITMSLIVSSFYAIGWTAFVEITDSNFYEVYAENQIDQLKKEGLSAQELQTKIEETREMSEMFQSPLIIFLSAFFAEILPVGIVVSLLTAAVLGRNRSTKSLNT